MKSNVQSQKSKAQTSVQNRKYNSQTSVQSRNHNNTSAIYDITNESTLSDSNEIYAPGKSAPSATAMNGHSDKNNHSDHRGQIYANEPNINNKNPPSAIYHEIG